MAARQGALQKEVSFLHSDDPILEVKGTENILDIDATKKTTLIMHHGVLHKILQSTTDIYIYMYITHSSCPA